MILYVAGYKVYTSFRVVANILQQNSSRNARMVLNKRNDEPILQEPPPQTLRLIAERLIEEGFNEVDAKSRARAIFYQQQTQHDYRLARSKKIKPSTTPPLRALRFRNIAPAISYTPLNNAPTQIKGSSVIDLTNISLQGTTPSVPFGAARIPFEGGKSAPAIHESDKNHKISRSS
jgi:hypothetical protein